MLIYWWINLFFCIWRNLALLHWKIQYAFHESVMFFSRLNGFETEIRTNKLCNFLNTLLPALRWVPAYLQIVTAPSPCRFNGIGRFEKIWNLVGLIVENSNQPGWIVQKANPHHFNFLGLNLLSTSETLYFRMFSKRSFHGVYIPFVKIGCNISPLSIKCPPAKQYERKDCCNRANGKVLNSAGFLYLYVCFVCPK